MISILKVIGICLRTLIFILVWLVYASISVIAYALYLLLRWIDGSDKPIIPSNNGKAGTIKV